jgi:pimeloyl-ACP methyl ester carboxylesterase
MKFIYIHGANATGDSFNYIREHLNHTDELVIEYDSKDGFDHNLSTMKDLLETQQDIFFICHSLGGIYALHLANAFPTNVLGAVTISTPYGGAESADYAKYFLPFSRLLRDIGPHSKPMRVADRIKVQHPWTNIVTTRGASPWILQPNDGIVTISSMSCRSDMELVELHTNHYEVIMHHTTVEILKNRIGKISD